MPADAVDDELDDDPRADFAGGWMPAALWILVVPVVAFVIMRPGTSLLSHYAFEWYAVGAVLLAVVGRRHTWAAMVSAGLGGVGGLYFAVDYLVQATIHGDRFGWIYVVGGVAIAASAIVQLLRATRWIDPVEMAAIQLGLGLLFRWIYYGFSGLGLDPNQYAQETWLTPFRAELPLLALGLAAVGLGVSRGWRQTLDRLDICWPAWWQVCLALSVSAALLLTVQWFNALTLRLTPQAYYDIGAIVQQDASAGLGIGLVYAVLAGIAEETLFRGAVQARLGLITAALLFSMIHIQYGVTMIGIYITLHGFAYGLLWRYVNTTTAIIAHTASDVMGTVGLSHNQFALVLLLMVIALTPVFLRSRSKVFSTVREGLAEDWSGFWSRSTSSTDE